jgi:hypothetical protein
MAVRRAMPDEYSAPKICIIRLPLAGTWSDTSSKSARPAKDFESCETVSIAESAQCPLVRCSAQLVSRDQTSLYTKIDIFIRAHGNGNRSGAQSKTNVKCPDTTLPQEVREASINAPPPVRSVDVDVAHCRPQTRFPHWPAIAYF